jgi:hypothetical protein
VSTHCLVGTIDPADPATARVRHVHSDGQPAYILPALDQIWSATCGHDTTALIEALLAHHWSSLGADVTADTAVTFTGEQPVPGVGMASEFDTGSQVELLPVTGRFDHVQWVFLIDPAQATITAYDPDDLTTPITVHHLTSPAEPAAADAVQPPAELVTAARVAGTAAGRRIADAWADEALADAAAQARVTAARILAGDPDTLQALPRPELTAGPGDTVPAALAGLVGESAWSPLTPADRAALLDRWRDAAGTALTDRVAARCRMLVSPTGDGRDLSHLHPDRLRIGGVGVFALDMAWTGADSELRIPVGFAGTLVDTWNGFAVFVCSRTVAEAIVADQQVHRDRLHTELIAQGHSPADADRGVDAQLARMSVEGDTIVVDETALSGDADAVTRIEPDRDGLYQVMGGSWTWEPVDPYECDRIVGELPTPAGQQQFVVLPHTWLRVPHDRIQVMNVRTVPETPRRSIAILALDGVPVAEADITPDGSHLSWLSVGLHRDDWAAYLTGCRRHGQPASEAQVLDALATEYQVGLAVRQADADGGVLTRLLAADGSLLRLRPVWPAPRGHAARRHLGELLCVEDPHPQGHLWQMWTGTAWRHLTSIGGFHQVADAPARQPNFGQLLAYLIGHSLYERLDRDQLIEQAAEHGIPLDPQWRDELIRDVLRAAHQERGRQAGLPVDDMPTLSAAEGLELGRIATGGTPDPHTDPSQSATAHPEQPSADPEQPSAP